MYTKLKFLLAINIVIIFNTSLGAQAQNKISRIDKNGNKIKEVSESEKENLLKKRFNETPLGADDFFELSFADFSKLLQTGFSNDVNGKNVSDTNVVQKFYKRNQVGIKTAISFKF